MLYLVAILLFVAVLIWDVITDYRKWLKSKAVDHKKESWLRIILLLPSMIFFIIAHSQNTWWVFVDVWAMTGFVFWFLFDGIYNKLRGFNWWFTGSDDADDAGTDNFLQTIPHWLHVTIKVLGMAASVTIYIL